MSASYGSTAGNFLVSRVPTGSDPKLFFANYVLNAIDETTLMASAKEDARRYVYNAVVSFLGGIAGLQTQQAAWAITKMYYAAFYIGRAALCRSRHVIFHVPKSFSGHTQYEIQLVQGRRATIVNRPSSTHKLVAQRFQQMCYPPFMTGLTIEGTDPLLWLMDQREYWQYRSARFSDPDFPSVLEQIETEKVQRLLAEYAGDKMGLYLSDPDHAVISVPFRLVAWALSIESLQSPGVVDIADLSYLRKRCRIGSQVLNAIGQHL